MKRDAQDGGDTILRVIKKELLHRFLRNASFMGREETSSRKDSSSDDSGRAEIRTLDGGAFEKVSAREMGGVP